MFAAMCLATWSSFATIYRVNNNTGISANFNSITAAMTAANNGDTLLLEPSTTNYGSITITKKLVILGNGYFNDAAINGGMHTLNTGLQANQKSSSLSDVNFYPGSEHSVLMGCTTNNVWVYASDITVKRCYMIYVYLNNYNPNTAVYSNRDSMNFSQNIISGSVAIYYFSATGGIGITDVNFQNNIFYNGYPYYGISLPAGVSGFFQNNVWDISQGTISMWGFQVSNNIMIGGYFTPNNCVYFNNIGTGTQFGNANSNQQNISTTSLFTNYAGTGQTETRYTLSPAGPGIAAGFNGVNVGPFGGPDPYRLSGIPPIPTIYSLSAPATTTSTTLQVTISTRSND